MNAGNRTNFTRWYLIKALIIYTWKPYTLAHTLTLIWIKRAEVIEPDQFSSSYLEQTQVKNVSQFISHIQKSFRHYIDIDPGNIRIQIYTNKRKKIHALINVKDGFIVPETMISDLLGNGYQNPYLIQVHSRVFWIHIRYKKKGIFYSIYSLLPKRLTWIYNSLISPSLSFETKWNETEEDQSLQISNIDESTKSIWYQVEDSSVIEEIASGELEDACVKTVAEFLKLLQKRRELPSHSESNTKLTLKHKKSSDTHFHIKNSSIAPNTPISHLFGNSCNNPYSINVQKMVNYN